LLGERGAVGVVVDEGRQTDALADQVADRNVDQRQVHGRDRDAALAVDRAGDAEPDGLGVRRRFQALAHLPLHDLEKVIELEADAGGGRAVHDALLGVHHPHRHLGSAEIRPDRLPHSGVSKQESGRGMRY
jgi:hypothetical protein